MIKYGFASSVYILVGGFEIAGVPRVGDITAEACPLHHQRRFLIRIKILHNIVVLHMSNMRNIRQIIEIRTNDFVVVLVFLPGQLVGSMRTERNAVLPQFEFSRRVDIIAFFFR